MKRLLQFAAIVVIGLMAAQPVLSSLTCVARMASSCAPGCPMGMSGMSPDCPMKDMSANQGCARNCCSNSAVMATLPQVSPVKAKVVVAVPMAILTSVAIAPAAASPVAGSSGVRSSSPPRYIANRVFRI